MTRLGPCALCGLPIVKGRESWSAMPTPAHLSCRHEAWMAAEATRKGALAEASERYGLPELPYRRVQPSPPAAGVDQEVR